jgi:hypothetical protein
MRTLHNTLMGLTLGALLLAGAGLLIPGTPQALAQHGHTEQAEAQAHFDAMVEQLELSDEQRAAIAPLFGRGYSLMLELHQIHAAMAAEMTGAQREQFADMMQHMLGGSMEALHEDGAMHEGGSGQEDAGPHEHAAGRLHPDGGH